MFGKQNVVVSTAKGIKIKGGSFFYSFIGTLKLDASKILNPNQ
jgi:hypothetical protein